MKRSEYEGKALDRIDERKIRKIYSTAPTSYPIFSALETQQDDIVILKLFDFNYAFSSSTMNGSSDEAEDFVNYLCKKLTQKMRARERLVKPFSMNFELAHVFSHTTKDHTIDTPCDVKISYIHGYILTTADDIHVFDLYTKKFITTFSIPDCELLYMSIEENFDGNNNDALFFDCYGHNCVFKYDLKRLIGKAIKKESHSCDFIWKSETIKQPRGMALWKDCLHFEENLLFVCDEQDNGSILILKSSTGQTIQTITSLDSPYGLTFDDIGKELFVSMLTSIEVFRKDNKNQSWVFDRLLHPETDEVYSQGLIYDKVSRTLISCDDETNRIQIFQPKNGSIIKEFNGDIFFPDSLCLNEMTGELYVCQDDGVKIFR
ncbi:hypothetical protein FDP41_001153 [Naegleria fowleri]|uniref:SMP-30/Gluconolactonase/LRE-like region domain-containing protein n=1 Tax=Naegleria fowleri TaxID=5763 RepID=A0A6A5C2C2_NAEFO|nr:uncharacterized protein FDP41_001153 [Naegleria fowleri]KAF0980000.1 hypothetical protein FDP41_001153 [Naegleria fowleri]